MCGKPLDGQAALDRLSDVVMDWAAELAGPHLADIALAALANGTLEEATDAADRHLGACDACQARFVRIAGLDSSDCASHEPIAPGEPTFPPLLYLVGRPVEYLDEIARRAGLPIALLEGGISVLRPLLDGPLAPLMAEAEYLARQASGGRFDRWKQRGPLAATPRSVTGVAAGEHGTQSLASGRFRWRRKSKAPLQWKPAMTLADSGAEDGIVMRAAAAGGALLKTHPTAPPHQGDRRYELVVQAFPDVAEMQVRCMVEHPAPIRPWAFRLKFESEDEARVLERAGFSPAHLGALRTAYGEGKWESLLDLLIPHRFGSAMDELYAEPIRAKWVRGRPPGEIVGYGFWLLESP